MRTSERADQSCSRFPAGSGGVTSLARARNVAHRATATGGAYKLLITIWILAVAVRLILIDQPYVDHWSWRQSDVAAIARNFSEGGFRFAHPQIDWAGNATGYVGTEFPILPFVAAICYQFAGIHEWIGRSQAMIFFAVSLPFLFLLVREIFGSTAAIWATFFFSFAPVNIFAGRSFMPDVPSLSLAIVGLCLFRRWIEDRESVSFLLAAITISLSILIKVTSIVIAAPLLYLAVAGIGDPGRLETKLMKSRDHRSGLQLLLFAAIALLPSAAWYWHIARQTATSSLTPILSIMALIGLFVAPRSRYSRLFHWWLAAMILFFVVVGYGNRHRWYQLPLVPIAAAFAGAACAFVGSKIASSRIAIVTLSILLASSFGLLSYLYVRPLYESSAAQLRDAGLELNKITAPGALIVAADMGDPTIFYYAQRKGWHFLEKDGIYAGTPSDSQEVILDLEQLRRLGATHFVFTFNTFWWLAYYPEFAQHLAQNATLIAATPEFRIYKLTVR